MLKQVSETKHNLNRDESMIGHLTGNQNKVEEIGSKPDIKYITKKKPQIPQICTTYNVHN